MLALFTAHVSGTTIAFTATTITDSGDGFTAAGFEAGQTIIIEGSSSNDAITDLLITNVTDGVLTVSGTALAVEAAGADITIHGGAL